MSLPADEKFFEKQHEAAANFTRYRNEDELDLVGSIITDLVAACDFAQAESFSNHPHIVAIKKINPDCQRTVLNNYFYERLCQIPKSHRQREALIRDGGVQDWLRLFRGKILPTVIEKKLLMDPSHD